jgi:hypothetical protein
MNWEKVGFQRKDPTTDLRQGIIGLVQLLYFATGPYRTQALQMLAASNTAVNDFPFAATSLNMTLTAIKALRARKLNKYITASNSTIDVFN